MGKNNQIIVITRPEQDGLNLAQKYNELGIKNIIFPVMRMKLTEIHHQPNDKDAWIFTSANGVRALSSLTNKRASLNYAVGPMTRDILLHHGFGNIRTAGGDSEKLRQLIQETHDKSLKLWHYGASEAEESLASKLRDDGFLATKITLYEMAEISEIAEELRIFLWQNRFDLVFSFYSPRTLTRTINLILKSMPNFPLCACQVISPAIAKIAEEYGFQEIHLLDIFEK